MRAVILVMDSVGIGAAPDAAAYGDFGAATVGHIAEACACGDSDARRAWGHCAFPSSRRLVSAKPVAWQAGMCLPAWRAGR